MCNPSSPACPNVRPGPPRSPWVFPLVWLVRGYQWGISPLLHALSGGQAGCRFQPTCSQYSIEALETHGVLHGLRLSLGRLVRCGPWSKGGYDPVPGAGEGEDTQWPGRVQPPAENYHG